NSAPKPINRMYRMAHLPAVPQQRIYTSFIGVLQTRASVKRRCSWKLANVCLRHHRQEYGPCAAHPRGVSFNLAALAIDWLMAFAIGITIYSFPMAPLLDSLTE